MDHGEDHAPDDGASGRQLPVMDNRFAKKSGRRGGAAQVFAVLALAGAFLAGGMAAAAENEGGMASRLPDKPVPFKSDKDLPARTPPIIELGDPFLGSGNLSPGFPLPTGAVWQPRLWVFGSFRSAVQTFDSGDADRISEWANRLNLFANLQLTGTERLLLGMEPLHIRNNFSGYTFENGNEGSDSEFNGRITTLFFEGDFGEIFPNLDPEDARALDYGFSVGRQEIVFQEGMLINDTIDAIGITRNSIRFPGISNLRVTFLYGWNNIHRDDNADDGSAQLFGLFTSTDLPISTVDVDVVLVDADSRTGSLLAGGIGAVQRIGLINTAIRVNGSYAFDDDTAQASDGALIFGEVSWTPEDTHNIAYVNGFVGIDEFSSAARGPTAGGPLGRTGILFAARGLGRFGAPLGNGADDSLGAAIGYQMFFDDKRRQLVLELGGRKDTGGGSDSAAIAARVQQAVGRRLVLTLEAFGALKESEDLASGARLESLVKF